MTMIVLVLLYYKCVVRKFAKNKQKKNKQKTDKNVKHGEFLLTESQYAAF